MEKYYKFVLGLNVFLFCNSIIFLMLKNFHLKYLEAIIFAGYILYVFCNLILLRYLIMNIYNRIIIYIYNMNNVLILYCEITTFINLKDLSYIFKVFFIVFFALDMCEKIIKIIYICIKYRQLQHNPNDEPIINPNDIVITTNVLFNQSDKLNFNHNTCSICLCNYNNDDILTKLICNHTFHKNCIDEWFKNKVICPLCNT
jgi:hypothetical protein